MNSKIEKLGSYSNNLYLTNIDNQEAVYPIQFLCSAIPLPKNKSLSISQQGQAKNVKALLKVSITVSDCDVSFKVASGREVLGTQIVSLA